MSYLVPVSLPRPAQGSKTEYQREQDIYAARLAQIKSDRRVKLWRWICAWRPKLWATVKRKNGPEGPL